MAIEVEHELHVRRRGRNYGVGLIWGRDRHRLRLTVVKA
jgi:hypothetical protein